MLRMISFLLQVLMLMLLAKIGLAVFVELVCETFKVLPLLVLTAIALAILDYLVFENMSDDKKEKNNYDKDN